MRLNPKYTTLILAATLLAACGNANTASAPKAETSQAATQEAPAAVVEKVLTPMERGAKLAKRCTVCHSYAEGGAHKVGPNLWGFLGSKAASKDGFNYSKAMMESGITWDEASFKAYIENPKGYVPGNRMAFVGVKKAEDREDLLLYLKSQTTP